MMKFLVECSLDEQLKYRPVFHQTQGRESGL